MEILISGASTGIGRASSIHLARLGHSVWAGVRSQKSYDELKKLNVHGLKPVFLDVCDERSMTAAVGQVKKTAGILHGLVNNAGIVVAGPVEAIPLEDWRRQFETNVFGQVRLTQLCLPLLRESKGRIVNTSSIAGRVAPPMMGAYAASKFALEAISDALRREIAKQGIYVSVVEPGPIVTPIWEKSIAEAEKSEVKYSEELQSVYGKSVAKYLARAKVHNQTGSPVSVVVEAIVHALTARWPRTRYPVGRGIRILSTVASNIPDSLLDKFMTRL